MEKLLCEVRLRADYSKGNGLVSNYGNSFFPR